MRRTGVSVAVLAALVAGALLLMAFPSRALEPEEKGAPSGAEGVAVKPAHVPEVAALLEHLKVDPPRTHKNMVVFPVRFTGEQAPGDWLTLDDALGSGALRIMEKDQATVSEVQVENTGDKSVLLVSGEIIRGGRQTRVVRKDVIVEARQGVAVPVFCVEQHRWAGDKDFKSSENMAPADIQESLKRGANQPTVWREVEKKAEETGERSRTGSLDEVIESDKVQKEYEDAHKSLGHFSPPETVGIAVADARTGRVVGLELFGRRDLFERLQNKLIEGYALDLVVGKGDWSDKDQPRNITEKDVESFIRRALDGRSQYESTPGSGRGLDLVAGALRGKGVAVGESVIHLSIQDLRPQVTPVRPVVDDQPPAPQREPDRDRSAP